MDQGADANVFNDKQLATTSASIKDTAVQSNSTEVSQQSLPSVNDAVKKRLLDSPTNIMENENQSTKYAKKAKRKKNSDNCKENSEEEKEVFSLLVSNFPFQWTKDQISEYIQEQCVDVFSIEYLDGGDPDSGQSIRLSFLNFSKSNEARKQLKLKSPNGRKLSVAFCVPEDSDSNSNTEETLLEKWEPKTSCSPSPWQSDMDMTDHDGLYGLRVEYLASLGITPPIDKWVHVSNFRCDKSELKEVLELAGHVVMCQVITNNKKYAKVMYSHPLEAVQAVSMLNGQLYYRQLLKVSMYRCSSYETILPKGLANIGPGLGISGKPLTDVVREYERYLSGKHNTVNESAFVERSSSIYSDGKNRNAGTTETNPNICTPKIPGDYDNTAQQPKRKSFAADISIKTEPSSRHNQSLDTTVTSSILTSPRKQRDSNIRPSIHQSYQQQTVGVWSNSAPIRVNCFRPAVPFSNAPITNKPYQERANHQPVQLFAARGGNGGFQGNNVPGIPVPRLVPNFGMNPACGPPTHTPLVGGSATVELSNLPLSTTFLLLSEKMAQVGPVMCLELTRPGCAIVRFLNPAHAQSCYQQYNNMRVIENVIEVRFI